MCLKQKIGKEGEDLACRYLKKKKYKIIERNFRCNKGEIDIIAYDEQNKELVFFEVKTRTTLKYGTPGEAVQKTKQNHIKSVAKFYMYRNRIKNISIRFDVVEVLLNNNSYRINHIKYAF